MLLSTDSIWRVKTHGGSDTVWTEAPSQFQLFWGPLLQHNYLHPNITVFQPVVHHHDRIWALDTFIQLLMQTHFSNFFSRNFRKACVCVCVARHPLLSCKELKESPFGFSSKHASLRKCACVNNEQSICN